MGLEVQTQTKEQEAAIMASPEIRYVSLVQHAANREPFRIVKNEVGGGDMGGSVVQRIVAPEGTDLIAVLKEEGIDFNGQISVDVKSCHNGFDIYTQAGVEKFDTNSFKLKRISEKSDSQVMVITGDLKPEFYGTGITVKADIQSPLESTVVNVDVEQGYYGMYIQTTTAMEALENELYNLSRGIYAIGTAAGMDGKSRLKSMYSMVDGFKTFIGNLMTLVEDNSTKSDNNDPEFLQLSKFDKIKAMISAVSNIDPAGTSNKNEEEDMGINAEELGKIVAKAVAEGLATKNESADGKTELETKLDGIISDIAAIKKEKEEAEIAAKEEAEKKEIADVKAQLEALTAEKEDLIKKVKDLEGEPDGTRQADAPHGVVKSDKPQDINLAGIKVKADYSCYNSLFKTKR